METRPYMAVDYAKLERWWKAHGWAPLPAPCLPEIGLMAGGICAGFLYRTDSKLALIEYIIADPESTKEDRKEAINSILNDLSAKAKELGYTAIFATLTHPSLITHYENAGFKVTDQNVTNVVRSL